MSSEFKVEVVPVALRDHPNADNLSLVDVYEYQVAVRTSDWADKSFGAYIPPDSVVDTTREAFKFLEGHERVRAKRLRGEMSFGLLMPLPPGNFMVGQDIAEVLGVTHYQPPENRYRIGEKFDHGTQVAPPLVYVPVYDVENMRRYASIFTEGEPVLCTEKIHGANGRWVWDDGKLHVGSRNQWKDHDGSSIWSRVAIENPELEKFCRDRPGWIVFGEVYGWVQDLHYGKTSGQIDYAVFDIMINGKYVNALEGREIGQAHGLKLVPDHAYATFDFDRMVRYADGPSEVKGADHNREGIVVKPYQERTDKNVGRVQLKLVSEWYLTRKE